MSPPTPLPALLPPLAGVAAGYALHAYVGGAGRVWAMADAAGPYSAMVVGAAVGLMCVLSLLLFTGPRTQPAPLVVLVGLALVPWLLGIAGTQDAMEKVLAALPGGGVDSRAALVALVSGTGTAMVTRLLGAWMSAALLGAVALGLVLQHWRTEQETRESGRLLGAALGLTLAGIALLVAIEAYDLFELLTPLATPTPGLPGHITTVSAQLGNLYQLRSACLGALAVLALALVGWQFFLRPEAVSQWAGSLTLVVLAATALFLDTQPLRLDVPSSRSGQAHATLQVRELLTSTLDAVARAPLQAPGLPPLP